MVMVAKNGSQVADVEFNGDGTLALCDDGAFHSYASLVQFDSIPVSSAQLLTLNDTAVQLIPPQGANRAICPISISIEYIFGGVAYTVPGGAVLQISPSNVVGNLERQLAGTGGGFLDTLASHFIENVAIAAIDFLKTDVNNAGLWLSLFGASDLTNGNGSIVVNIAYMVVTLS